MNVFKFDTLKVVAAISGWHEASLHSSTTPHNSIWPAKCNRVGSRCMPNQNQIEEPSTKFVNNFYNESLPVPLLSCSMVVRSNRFSLHSCFKSQSFRWKHMVPQLLLSHFFVVRPSLLCHYLQSIAESLALFPNKLVTLSRCLIRDHVIPTSKSCFQVSPSHGEWWPYSPAQSDPCTIIASHVILSYLYTKLAYSMEHPLWYLNTRELWSINYALNDSCSNWNMGVPFSIDEYVSISIGCLNTYIGEVLYNRTSLI